MKPRYPTAIEIAWMLTVAVSGLALLVFITGRVWQDNPNEIGDYLAGFAGTLSFVWIITTILLQKEELSLQRREINRLASESESQSSYLLSSASLDFLERWGMWSDQFDLEYRSTFSDLARQLVLNAICEKKGFTSGLPIDPYDTTFDPEEAEDRFDSSHVQSFRPKAIQSVVSNSGKEVAIAGFWIVSKRRIYRDEQHRWNVFGDDEEVGPFELVLNNQDIDVNLNVLRTFFPIRTIETFVSTSIKLGTFDEMLQSIRLQNGNDQISTFLLRSIVVAIGSSLRS